MTALDDVFAYRQRCWANGYRPVSIYSPNALDRDGEPLPSAGKRPVGKDWLKRALQDPPDATRRRPGSSALNTGLICGEVVGLDVDILDQALADQVVHAAEQRLGLTPLVRVGLAPKVLLAYRVDAAFSKIQTPEMVFPDGAKAKVELLAEGQQFVVDGIHPATGQPYRWTGEGTPETVALANLPVIAEANARSFIAEAEAVLRAAGAVPKKEKEAKERQEEQPEPSTAFEPREPGPRLATDRDFFRKVNAAALANIKAWAPSLLPRGHWEQGTGAWRVSSKDLGRNLEEDVSIHPDGIHDFGEEKTLTPIDVVLRWGTASKPLAAAQWLAEQLGFPKPSPQQRGNGLDHAAGQEAEEPALDDEAEILRLAGLKLIDYERQRAAAAKRLGITRVAQLDTLVKLARGSPTTGQGAPLEYPEIKPWPHPVDGAQLLDALAGEVRRFVVLGEAEAAAVALWVLATHHFTAFAIFPRLFITAAEMQSGKTTLLDVIGLFVQRPQLAGNITAAALFRVISLAKPTLLLDEADTYAKDNEELRGIINAGHKSDGTVIRTVGDQFEPRTFSIFAPMAIAAIGNLHGTVLDRSIPIRLQRRRADEPVDRLRGDRTLVEHGTLARQASRWAADHSVALATADPSMPAAMTNRTVDNWLPLLAIADLAGGEWPVRARAAALRMTGNRDAASSRTQLLTDIRAAFAVKDTDRLSSDVLVNHLVSLEDRPWPEWGRARKPLSKTQLARLLLPLHISPANIRFADGTVLRGYHKNTFDDAFARYLPSEGI